MAPKSGKAVIESLGDAYDEIAEREGIDVNGDPVEVDDDEPAIEAAEEQEEDSPVIEAESAPDQEENQQITGEADLVEEALLAPHTWQDEWKDGFNSIQDRAMQQAILDQNANMNKAFTDKMTNVAELRRDLDGIKGAMQPHMERLQRAGITPDVAVQRSLAWDAHIQQNPAQGIMDMAKAYGVDLSATIQSQTESDQYLTPMERQLRQDGQAQAQSVQQLQQQMVQWNDHQQRQEWQGRQQNAYAMLDTFMNAKDDSGNRLHRYIEHVDHRMTQLVQENNLGLEAAYSLATSESPEIQAAQTKSRQAAQVKATKDKAEKVRKASRSGIVGKSSGKGPKAPMSTEQLVSAAYEQTVNAR